MNRKTTALLQSLGNVPLLTVMSSNRAKYVIMASPPNFSMALGIPSDPTDLLLAIVFNRFLITLILVVNVLSE